MIAASILNSHGIRNFTEIEGGLTALKKQKNFRQQILFASRNLVKNLTMSQKFQEIIDSERPVLLTFLQPGVNLVKYSLLF
jgi:hypothetical protein